MYQSIDPERLAEHALALAAAAGSARPAMRRPPSAEGLHTATPGLPSLGAHVAQWQLHLSDWVQQVDRHATALHRAADDYAWSELQVATAIADAAGRG